MSTYLFLSRQLQSAIYFYAANEKVYPHTRIFEAQSMLQRKILFPCKFYLADWQSEFWFCDIYMVYRHFWYNKYSE